MSNTMTTYVKIVNLNEDTFSKVKELFETENENSSDVKITNHFNKLFDTDFKNDEDNISREWMDENIGSKWINVQFGDVDYTPEVDLTVETYNNVPVKYIQKVVEVLNEVDKNIVAYGTYEDDEYSTVGSFVYGYDYDDIEDYDDFDSERVWDDDDYMEEMYEGLYELRNSLYDGYLEVVEERKLEEK